MYDVVAAVHSVALSGSEDGGVRPSNYRDPADSAGFYLEHSSIKQIYSFIPH